MPPSVAIALGVLIFVAAALYSSVGHGGASAYLAAMALFGVAPEVMKPTALTLNILVAGLATWKFARAGHFSWPLLWPFMVTAAPAAFAGGALVLPASVYRPLLGAVLLLAALRLSLGAVPGRQPVRPLALPVALGFGSVIGFVSGLTGVGGGIFLSPLLLFLHWADNRRTAAVSAAFILVNSMAGLLGHVASVKSLPPQVAAWSFGALAGGWIGAEFGSRRLGGVTLRRLLAIVLVVAGLKLVLTR